MQCGHLNFWQSVGDEDRALAATSETLSLATLFAMLSVGFLLVLPVQFSGWILRLRRYDRPALWVQGMAVAIYSALIVLTAAELWLAFDCAGYVKPPGEDGWPAAYGLILWGLFMTIVISVAGAVEFAIV